MKALIALFFLSCSLHASLITTNSIADIEKDIDDQTLVIFNIAEVLLDTETQLGTQNWRKYVRQRLEPQLHDRLTLLVFEKVPPKAVEQVTPQLIERLQSKVRVLAFTSRGRNEWYSSQIPHIDTITEKALKQVGLDFSKSKPLAFDPFYFHDGIVYGTNNREKGELLVEFLRTNQLKPSRIVFVDDKKDSLVEVEGEMQKLGIPFSGYVYQRTAADHQNFDPVIANIQLDWLLNQNKVISDEEAQRIKASMPGVDPEAYFNQLIEKWKGQLCSGGAH